ncbi:MAG: benzoyl-CoA 2,3-epoxidase subunit BoxA [Rhodocyclales bacterium]|jgi:benzoyl-CoA 2,3-dioxygenase component A|nr:benzoyl-CoA 2,3-epoxidase subunit BoxA [Rhodocyclales bacterium]
MTTATTTPVTIMRQHLIDPEICIRCNTCEETCPVDAISHDSRNYVVDASKCKYCYNCISPCPTGAIDNWRHVVAETAYPLAEQLLWDTLPEQVALDESAGVGAGDTATALPDDVEKIAAASTSGQGGVAPPPWSAAHPYINLYSIQKPAVATVSGNFRLTAPDASSDIRHIVLDFGNASFPVLEGQTIGILAPGLDAHGKPHHVRLYSVASPRDGERPRYNNLSLTVKRVTADHEGKDVRGIASNYLCDLKKGDKVNVVGPYGTSFLMPNHPGSNLLMICTGTGSAPMRAMTERRRRKAQPKEDGKLMLFFGARTPDELPYFGPLTRLPKEFIDINFAFSRIPAQPRQYVQDLIRSRADEVVGLLRSENTYLYLCGLKGMEKGVDEAFTDICGRNGLEWKALQAQLLQNGRYHVETY